MESHGEGQWTSFLNVRGVADDILEGTDAIAAFLGITHRRAKYLIERRLIPYGNWAVAAWRRGNA